MKLVLRGYTLDLGRKPRIMGILNVTPDSFWDGGKYARAETAIERARRMVTEGADIIDVGGESTRPGSQPVSAREEIERVGPVVEDLVARLEVPVSIDTRKSAVAREMLKLGAHMVNDISGLTFDEAMADVVREYDVPVVIMHMRGTPSDMQNFTQYDDVVIDVRRELAERIRMAESAGLRPESIIVDPGIGFSKMAEQCVEIVARLEEFHELGKPLLIGPSRKSFMGKTLGLEPQDRLEATIACCVVAGRKGAGILRVHDIGPVARALAMLDSIAEREIDVDTRVHN